MRPGFTRIDLLVLIFVAFLAIAMLLPGCEQHHTGARRAECTNNEMQLSRALAGYESLHHEFPGYRQELAGADAGWGVMILPQIDRDDLWQSWKQGRERKVRLSLMICPSDPPKSSGPEDGWCSYAVNTRICQDGKGLSLDYITSKDGTANTLLVAENLRSMKPHTWWDTVPNAVGFSDGPLAYNVQSNHGGGAVVAFCDGHAIFLRDDIGDDLFKALVTPDGGERIEADKL